MRGLVIELQAPLPVPAPNRADVACFVGFVARRRGVRDDGTVGPRPSILPPSGRPASAFPLYRWFREQGWARSNERIYDRASLPRPGDPPSLPPPQPPEWTQDDATLDELLDVPVPIDSWEIFDRLFDWNRRPITVSSTGELVTGATYLGAAVRSFFAQGGRRCYVVRVGDPWQYDSQPSVRRAAIDRLLGLKAVGGANLPPDRRDRNTWKGVGHLHGLPEVSFLCLPDLADAVAAGRPWPPEVAPETPPVEEVFVECSDAEPEEEDAFVRGFLPPLADEEGYTRWADVVRSIGTTIQRDLREVQYVAAVPLPHPSVPAAAEDLLDWLESSGWLAGQLSADDGQVAGAFSSAFVQLAWPWLKTTGSRQLPGELESPDAVLTGVLARSTLIQGSYRNAARLPVNEAFAVEPGLRGQDLELPEFGGTLVKRVSLIGPTPRGFEVLSDVTTSRNEGYRQANVNRLVSAIVRAARRIGEEVTFEASGPRLWRRIRRSMESLLTMLWQKQALGGTTAPEAFQVRCDRSTMSRRDLDEGRAIIEITIQPTASIERIRVILATSRGVTSQVGGT